MRSIFLLLLLLAVAGAANIFRRKYKGKDDSINRKDGQIAQVQHSRDSGDSGDIGNIGVGSKELKKLKKEEEQRLKLEQEKQKQAQERQKKEQEKLKKEQAKLKKEQEKQMQEQERLRKEQEKLQKHMEQKNRGSSKDAKVKPNSKEKPTSQAKLSAEKSTQSKSQEEIEAPRDAKGKPNSKEKPKPPPKPSAERQVSVTSQDDSGASKEAKFKPDSKKTPKPNKDISQGSPAVPIPATVSSQPESDISKSSALAISPSVPGEQATSASELTASIPDISFVTLPTNNNPDEPTILNTNIPVSVEQVQTEVKPDGLDATAAPAQPHISCQSCKSGILRFKVVTGTDCRSFMIDDQSEGDAYSCPSGMRFDQTSCACNADSMVLCAC